MQRKSILKDTIQLTVVQMGSLLLNVWLTHALEYRRLGILTKIAFLQKDDANGNKLASFFLF